MSMVLATQNVVDIGTSGGYGREKVELLKATICKGATDDELGLFLEVCKSKRLDPFAKQIYAIKRWDSTLKREAITYQVGIDGFRTLAERTGKYAGQDDPLWCGEDGIWKDVWLSREPPRAAKISVHKNGFAKPMSRVALYSEYVQLAKEGGPNSMWKKMPSNQLAKCAEALSLRAAFPEELSGLYTPEEMGQSENSAENSKETRAAATVEQKALAERKLDVIKAEPKTSLAEMFGTRQQFQQKLKNATRAQLTTGIKQLYAAMLDKHGKFTADTMLAEGCAELHIESHDKLERDGAAILCNFLFDKLFAIGEISTADTKAEPVSPEITAIWKRIIDIQSTVNELTYLREMLGRHIGTAMADEEYYAVLSSHGVKHSNEFKGDLVRARSAARQLWELVASAEKADNDLLISDDDVPN